jgi:hypothetical protein
MGKWIGSGEFPRWVPDYPSEPEPAEPTAKELGDKFCGEMIQNLRENVSAEKRTQEDSLEIPDRDTALAAAWLRENVKIDNFSTPMFWLVAGLLAIYKKS